MKNLVIIFNKNIIFFLEYVYNVIHLLFLQKGKINKAEDASLLDNEYKSGNITPIKSPTVEDFSKKDVSESNIMIMWCTYSSDMQTQNTDGMPREFIIKMSYHHFEIGIAAENLV